MDLVRIDPFRKQTNEQKTTTTLFCTEDEKRKENQHLWGETYQGEKSLSQIVFSVPVTLKLRGQSFHAAD